VAKHGSSRHEHNSYADQSSDVMLSNPSCTPKADYSGVKERKYSRERARDNVSRTWGEKGGGGGAMLSTKEWVSVVVLL